MLPRPPVIISAVIISLMFCMFVHAANNERATVNILYSAVSSGSFNHCEYEYKDNAIRIFAENAKDPGVFFGKINKDVEGHKYLSFAIKGGLVRSGLWCFPIVQVYDEKDDEYTPSVTKTSFTFKNDEYVTVLIPLEKKVKILSRIQFVLVTDKGSWDVEIKDMRLE
jgi:hypothetical protein